MQKAEIIAKIKALNFPKNSFVVFGSAPMAIAGLREANDIDLLVSEALFEELKHRGWKELDKGEGDKPLVYDIFEAHSNWNFSSYSPTLDQLLSSADMIEDIPFAALPEVRKWKMASGRPKDLRDIELLAF